MKNVVKSASLCIGFSLCLFSCGGEKNSGSEEAPSTTESVITEGAIQFHDETLERGIDFAHVANRTEKRWMPEIMGSGLGVADFNRDGAPDLYLVGGGSIGHPNRSAASRDRLFLNDGNGQFTDVSKAWKVEGVDYGMGVACGDYDNDGWTDILLTGYGGGERLLRNTGSAFEDVTHQVGLDRELTWGTGAGFFDADGDGDLDIYVVRYVDFDLDSATTCWSNGRPVPCSPQVYEGLNDTLWINKGDGTFRDAGLASGVGTAVGKGLALTLGDLDWDGDVDIYVANDTTANQLYMNDGKAVFKDAAAISGVAYSETGSAAAGMGADFSDVDGNGTQDIVCANFQNETTNIYLQGARGAYRDKSFAMGVGASARKRLSFGLDFF
ncbi:MAG: hypothetical protein ACI82F_004135, partial [Planctomycetota bacterium]